MVNNPTVRVSEGILEGECVQNEFGGSYCSFKGIPFAEPPVGELRFKPPQPPKPWSGVRNAKEFGPICYQFNVFKKTPPSGSEDCLYLNVYTPELQPKAPLPVMVWIHGGGFFWGSGDDDLYGPEFLIRHGVILVTFNYRLGVLGFLCLDTKDVPGNAGMKDQVAALRWVKQNISNFGGDPDNITIFGESAGGASVTYHLLSPMSKGLFKRAIAQSGTANSFWAQSFAPRERAIVLARYLGLDTEDVEEIYKFLKIQPIEKFINLELPVSYSEKESFTIDFAPTVEKDFGQERFVIEDVNETLTNNKVFKGLDLMIGYVEDEGIIDLGLSDLNARVQNTNNFREALVPNLIAQNIPIAQQLEVGRKMKEYYFDDKSVSTRDWKKLTRYTTFNMFIYNIVHFQKRVAIANSANKSYFYKFTCKSKRNFFKKVFTTDDVTKDIDVVCHCDDLSYLFPIKFMEQKVDIDSEEFKLIERVCKLWTNFAKFGNPTPDDSLEVKWEPYCFKHQRYMDIGSKLIMASRPEDEEMKFWEEIFKQYLPRMAIQ